MTDASAHSLPPGLWNGRCLLRGRCGCHGSGPRVSGPPAPASVRLDTFGSTLPGDRSCGVLDMDRSGERHDGIADARNPAGRLDEATRPMGVYARRARGSSDYCTRCPCALNTR